MHGIRSESKMIVVDGKTIIMKLDQSKQKPWYQKETYLVTVGNVLV